MTASASGLGISRDRIHFPTFARERASRNGENASRRERTGNGTDDGDDRHARIDSSGTRRATPYRDDRNAETLRALSISFSLSVVSILLSLSLRFAPNVAQLIAAIYASERRAAAPVRTERSAVRIALRTFTILVNTRVT